MRIRTKGTSTANMEEESGQPIENSPVEILGYLQQWRTEQLQQQSAESLI